MTEARVELAGLLVATATAAWLLRRERRMTRVEGAVLVVLYAVFLSAVAIAPRT